MKPVLVVGAGPTGLVMALVLARRGVPVHIIDAKEGPAEESRAMGVHARTLEFYRQFGFAEAVVDRGMAAKEIRFRARDRDGARFSLRVMGAGLSPYPYMLTFPQDQHERFLLDRLADLGVAVDWGATLEDFVDRGEEVEAVIRSGASIQRSVYAYIIGCDGAHSRVLEVLGIGFPGGSSEQMFYVADAMVAGAAHDVLYLGLSGDGLALMMPVRTTGSYRIFGLVPPGVGAQQSIGWADVGDHSESLLGFSVGQVNWFSTYHVHHRVAERFRSGRVFIAGDAGHIHSPAGGQGMKTGIGDAVNLSWKIADVMHERADSGLLDTYERERLPFARFLVATTDRAFRVLVDDGRIARAARVHLVPRIVSTVMRFSLSRRLFFKTFSQTRISYRRCSFNQGKAGALRGGDRLPWISTDQGDNFAALQTMSWQLHNYGRPANGVAEAADQLGLPVHRFPWSDAAHRAGVQRDASYLVRPDGYVALALGPTDSSDELTRFVELRHLDVSEPHAPSS
ncbi:MAG: FAD-dependent monooxygenase [Mycobacterium sp.]|nr:FAD-dependent monooxygenase [Mycobacterium sp.]